MKKGSRRKANKRRTRQFIIAPALPQGIKRKRSTRKGRKNPLWGAMDQKAMRKMVNDLIGSVLIQSLNIDFLEIMERNAQRESDKPITETLQ